MIKYRPVRGSLLDAMSAHRDFLTVQDMFEWIVEHYASISCGPAPFDVSDLVLGDTVVNDRRIGWVDTRAVCVKRWLSITYEHPACIGHCASVFEMPSDFSWLPEHMRSYAMERALKHFSPSQENGGEQK